MKTKLHQILTISLLSVLVVLSIILSNCAKTTGQPTETTPMETATTEIAPTSQPVVKDITPEETNQMLITSNNTISIIDVRTPQEYASGYIRGAINIDLNSPTFKDEIGKLDKNKTYIVYCRSGSRSAAARGIMEGLGFQHVINMLGGVTTWEAAGLPLEK